MALLSHQRRTYLDSKSVFREQTYGELGESAGFVAVEGEQNQPCRLFTTNQFDTPNSIAGVNNKDNLETADYLHEEVGRDTQAGDLLKVVMGGQTFWYTVKGGAKEVPTRGTARTNFQEIFLVATPEPPGVDE